jgi:hypothetical protein
LSAVSFPPSSLNAFTQLFARFSFVKYTVLRAASKAAKVAFVPAFTGPSLTLKVPSVVSTETT